MKEQLHIVAITIGLFVAGLLMGIWTQRTRPIPAPPAPVLGEFGGVAGSGVAAGPPPGVGGLVVGRFSAGHPATVATINRNLAELEPRLQEFQRATESIEDDFRQKLDDLLTVEQRKKLASVEANERPQTFPPAPGLPPPFALGAAPVPPMPLPPPGEANQFFVAIRPPMPAGGWRMLSMIIYQPSLQYLTGALELDAKQQASIRELMVNRRTQLLALIDKTPPPSLGLGDALP